MPLFDYQKEVVDALMALDGRITDKHVWVKKSRGLGISELVLRLMAWLCLKDTSCRGAQMAIITGPRLELAIDMINRIKGLFLDKLGVTFDTDKTVIMLNGCTVKGYPSNANTSRGQPDMRFIFLDEADFFSPSEQKQAREAAEGYIGKSDPYIILVSTPALPGGLYEKIERESEESCIYKRIFLPYTVGLGKIYSAEDIEKAKASPSFPSEYGLQYGVGQGNIFPSAFVDLCVQYYEMQMQNGRKTLAVDPGYGSSKFAILGAENVAGVTYIREARQYARPSPSAMADVVTGLYRRDRYGTCLVDGSQAGIVTELRGNGINIIPVNFREKLSDMTMATAKVIKEQKVRIHPAFNDLIQQLKAVSFNERGHPDKRRVDFDLGDCLLMIMGGNIMPVVWADIGTGYESQNNRGGMRRV